MQKRKPPAPVVPEIVAELAKSLHDIAQPLTVLQGGLELALFEMPARDSCRQEIESALEQAALVVAALERLRQLVRLLRPASDVVLFDVLGTLKSVLEAHAQGFSEQLSEIILDDRCDAGAYVETSPSRLQQVLDLVVSEIPSMLSSGGRVVTRVRCEPDRISISFAMPEADAGTLSALAGRVAVRSRLELARSFLAASEGTLTYIPEPPSILISLPQLQICCEEAERRDRIHV